MKATLERLWNEYFAEECARIDTDEQRSAALAIAELHEKLTELLDKEQNAALQGFIDALYKSEAAFMKKAFFAGCKFATSFFLEVADINK